jgi:hypothetical protein
MRRRSSNRSNFFGLAPIRLALAGALAVGSLACGSEKTPTPEAAAPSTSNSAPGMPDSAAPSEATPPVTDQGTDQGSGEDAIASEGVIPEGFPSDVPIYPGATPGSSMAMPGLGVFATFQTGDSVDKILSHYRSELANGGWSVADTPTGDGVDGTKGKRSVQVRVRAGEDGNSEIAISFSES